MPRGRQPNYDKRIGDLLDQLRDAIIAREKAAMDARVSDQVRALVSSIGTQYDESTYRRLASAAARSNGEQKSAAPSPKKRGPRKGNPKLKSKLKAYWANLSPEQKKARIAKMHAWRRK